MTVTERHAVSVSPAEVAAVCAEVDGALRNAPIQKIAETGHFTLAFGTPRNWLLICVAPELGRLHLLPKKPAGSGENPSGFCMLLRKHLEGARLLSCAAVPGERAAAIDFVRGIDRTQLRIFLFGRAAQLVLVDADARTLGHYGPARELHAALPLPLPLPPNVKNAAPTVGSPSVTLSARFAEVESTLDIDTSDTRARKVLRGARARLQRLHSALLEDLSRVDAAAGKRKLADLLLAHLSEIPRGSSAVTLPDDFTDGSPIEIALLPDRSARANAERFYAEHKRMSRARERIEGRLDETRLRLEALSRDEAALDAGLSPSIPLPPPQAPTRSKARDAPQLPYRIFHSEAGVAILVGKGADKNDALTFGVANGRDLWLHARDVPGAHVVISNSGRDVDEQTLLDAATLAAHYSHSRNEPQVDITYTQKKNVRKAKGPNRQGKVLISDGKTLRIRQEESRLKRLLTTQ